MGKFTKGPNEEDFAISMPSNIILDNGDIRQAWMTVY
jgi:hypothetical protein